MVTLVYRVIVKQGQEEDFKNIALRCTKYAKENTGCLYYNFFNSLTNPNEFIVYYRFASKADQDTHIKHLQEKIGPPKTGRDLPAKFLNLLTEEELVLFKLTEV